MIMFETTPGSVLLLDDPATQGVLPLVRTPNQKLDFATQKVLITGVGLAEETSHQFMHTLGGDIYIYVFGDRIGQMTISGLACARQCSESKEQQTHGFEQTMLWYRQNKMSARPDPIQVLIGNTPLKGFVVGLQGSVADPNAFLMRFDLTLMILPEKPDTQPGAPTPSNAPVTPNLPADSGGSFPGGPMILQPVVPFVVLAPATPPPDWANAPVENPFTLPNLIDPLGWRHVFGL